MSATAVAREPTALWSASAPRDRGELPGQNQAPGLRSRIATSLSFCVLSVLITAQMAGVWGGGVGGWTGGNK